MPRSSAGNRRADTETHGAASHEQTNEASRRRCFFFLRRRCLRWCIARRRPNIARRRCTHGVVSCVFDCCLALYAAHGALCTVARDQTAAVATATTVLGVPDKAHRTGPKPDGQEGSSAPHAHESSVHQYADMVVGTQAKMQAVATRCHIFAAAAAAALYVWVSHKPFPRETCALPESLVLRAHVRLVHRRNRRRGGTLI